MVLLLMPVDVFAAETYELYINEFQFSSDNLTYTGETGNAVYNPGTKTLTLNNLTVTTKSFNTLIYSIIPGLTIQINGTLKLNLLDSAPMNDHDIATYQPTYGIALNGDTTIRGTNSSPDKDCIVIDSKSVGVEQQEFEDGTTRVGIATNTGSALTLENITVRMNDNSTGSYAGHVSMIRPQGTLNVSGCKLEANQCQLGVYMDADAAAATISNTVFAMNLSGTSSSGVNFVQNSVNRMENCSGSITADYPVYTYGQLTITGSSKLTLITGNMAVVANQYDSNPGGELIFDNANVEIQSEGKGLQIEENCSITMKGGTVAVTRAACGVLNQEGGSFSMQGGTLSICGADSTSSVGIDNCGTMTVAGGSLKTENVYTAIQNRSGKVNITGGEHTLTASAGGYLGVTSSELQISNTARVTVNAETGIQLSAAKSGNKLTVSGGELNLNTTGTGIDLPDSSSTMTLSGGKVNITDKNASPTMTGMVCAGQALFSGAEVTFTNCKIDLLSRNSNNKMTGGKLHLSGYGSGAQFYFGFEMTGGVIDGSADNLGIVAANGTTTLKGGTVDITAYSPFCLTYGGIVDFAGANVTGKAASNCALYVADSTKDSYKISGGTVVLTSNEAGANEMYTSLPGNYGVWAGADEAGAVLVDTPTQAILATSKYVRFAEKKAVTLTLENVKEGTSASWLPGASFTYTAKDAPSDQHFSHWELIVNGSATNVGTSTVYSGKMPDGDATLTAVFEYCSGGTAATCQKLAVCDVCGKEYGILAAHKLTAEVEDSKYMITPATCESEGTYYKSCSVCGASSENWNNATFTVSALGHDWSEWTSNSDGTHSRICSRDADHKETEYCSGDPADCTHGPICTVCHEEYGTPGDHSYTAEVVNDDYLKAAATCTEAAVYYKSCTGCGKSSKGTEFEDTFSYGEALGHAEEIDPRQEPTCTEDGLTEGKHCSRCQTVLVEQSSIPALGHNITGGTVTKDPTCTEDGEKVGTCERCGETNVTAKVEKLGHEEIKVSGTAPTCSESGWSDSISCTRCGEVLQESSPLAPLGHTVVEDAGTETLTKGMHCSVCGEVLLAQISKSGGRWTDDGNYDAELYASEPGNWVISDAADLAALAKKVNDGNSFEGFTITVTADLDLSAHLWVPIGYGPKYFEETNAFRGTFRGGLHTVSGMRIYMDGYAENWAVAGLFGTVCGAEITDLQLSGDVFFFSQPQQYNCVGGLAGKVVDSTLRNCGFVGTVCGDSLYREYVTYRIGGLAGYSTGSTVENCYAIANVNAMNTYSSCDAYTGGLFGMAYSSAAASNCYTAATVTLKSVNKWHSWYGTFEGGNDQHATADNCYTQIANVGPNGSAAVLTREQMQSADGLVKMLNAYVRENGNEKDRGWFVDPTVNQGYPTFGLTVRFETGIKGEKGAVVGVKPGSAVTPADGEIPGYTFRGWFADEGCTTAFDFSRPITADTIVYGQYDPNVFSISYVLNGGENSADNPTEYVYGVGAALADAVRENYLFEGWYTDKAFTQRITEIDTKQTGALILFAKWSIDPAHTHAYGTCRVGENGLHEQVCEICGKVEPATCTPVITEPTCTERGFTTYICTGCSESYISDYVEPNGHSLDNGTVTKEPTSTEKGEKLYTCTVCGYTEKSEIDKLPATDTARPAESNPDTGAVTSTNTGDNSNLFLWIVLLLAGGFGVIGIGVYGRHRRNSRAK